MRKLIYLALSLSTACLHAEQPTGAGASEASNIGQDNQWQTWLFAGGSVASAVTGVLVVALVGSGGSQSH